MSLTNALTISIAVLAGLVTWALVAPLAEFNMQVWIVFISWAAYYASGGTTNALSSNIPAHILGAVVGWAALVAISHYGDLMGPGMIAGIAVGLGAAVIVQCSKMGMFSNIPCAVLAFAAIAGYTLLAGKMGDLYSTDPFGNPLSVTIISLILGAIVGWISESIGSALSS